MTTPGENEVPIVFVPRFRQDAAALVQRQFAELQAKLAAEAKAIQQSATSGAISRYQAAQAGSVAPAPGPGGFREDATQRVRRQAAERQAAQEVQAQQQLGSLQQQQLRTVLAAGDARRQARVDAQAEAQATAQVRQVQIEAANAQAAIQTEAVRLRQQNIATIEAMSKHELELTRRTLETTEAQKRYNIAIAEGNQLQIINARQALLSAQAAEKQAAAGGAGGFFSGVARGFGGGGGGIGGGGGANAFRRTHGEAGEFLGAIGRYQAAYASIFAITIGIGALVRAEAAGQDGMIELGRATGFTGSKLDDLGATLTRISTEGGQSFAAAIQTGTRAVLAFGAQGAQAALVARTSVQAAVQAQLLSGVQDVNVAQQQLIATTKGFDLAFDQQSRVLDAAALAARHYGAGMDQILAGLPQVAEVSREAGLSLEETANLLSVSIARSTLSGQGVASLFNRFVGNFNERPETRQQLAGYGVDTTGTAGEVLLDLTKKWSGLSEAQQQATLTALGGHEVAKALLPILQEGQKLLDANTDSYQHAGYATQLYYDRLNNLAGLLRTLLGDVQEFGHELFRTGAFDIFGVALKTLHDMIEGIDAVLRLVNSLPGDTEKWLVQLGEVALIWRTIRKLMVETAAVQQLSLFAGGGGTGRFGSVRAGFTEARTAGAGRFAASRAGLAGLLAGEAGGAAAAGAAVPPVLAVTAGLIALTAAIGGTVEALHANSQAAHQSKDAFAQAAAANTAEEHRAAASALGDAAAERRHAARGYFGALFHGRGFNPGLLGGGRGGDEEAAAQAEQKIAQALENARRAQIAVGEFGGFFTRTGDAGKDIINGLEAMRAAGVPAVAMLDALNNALDAAGKPRGLASARFGTEAQFSEFILGSQGQDGKPGRGGLLDLFSSQASQDDPRKIFGARARLADQIKLMQRFLTQARQQGFFGPEVQALQQALATAEHQFVTDEVARLGRFQEVAVNKAGTNDKAVLQANVRYTEQKLKVAAKFGDEQAIVALIGQTSKEVIDVVRRNLQAELRVAQASFAALGGAVAAARASATVLQAGLQAGQQALLGRELGVQPNDQAAAAQKAVRDSLASALAQLQGGLAQAVPGGASESGADAAFQAALARAGLHRPGYDLSAAAARLRQARLELNHAKAGTAEYYQAVQGLRDAQYDYANAVLEHQHQLRLGRIDITDPVAQAREDLRAAQAKLAADRAHGTGDITVDQNQVRENQARLEAAQFEKTFSAMQTADQLGRITHEAYLRYLQHEHERLVAIHHRTYQQQQELDQIDQAIKSAADAMQGQWNLGDIRIPTPYEARRYIQAVTQAQQYQQTIITNTNTITISGADNAKVVALLTQLLGPQAIGTTTTATRKV